MIVHLIVDIEYSGQRHVGFYLEISSFPCSAYRDNYSNLG